MIPDDILDHLDKAFQAVPGGYKNSMYHALIAAEAVGWKLVPREPTEIMELAAVPVYEDHDVWRAMWDAS